ncbi:cytochrome P450 [Roseateles sp.]|uniref:cytochrome P450 n=1 Tax=Roseateles sp. TaxID=1971397 RepID=UPI0025CDF675|nr:cytochrome P450 [Roseateles sp.]MBV8033957.1 cytochrome P450 [Roseateles sp.]
MSTTAAPPAGALRQFDDLPGPRGVPVFGNLLQIDSTRVHQQVEAWCEEFGPIFKLRLGRRRLVVVGDHDLISTALRDRPDGFRRTQRLEDIGREMGLDAGLFGANGEVWKRQRRMVMAGFDPVHVKRYYPFLLRVAGRLVDRWHGAACAGQPIALQADLMRFTVDAVAGLAFGEDVNTLQSDEDIIQRHLNRIFPMLFKRIFAPLPIWRWWPSAEDRALARSVAEVNAAVQGFIAQARARMAADPALRVEPGNLLEAMLVAADEPGSGIDDEQVAGNVLTLLLAGEDTTANTLAWMIWLLWQHPEALARARAEVDGVCGDAALPSLEQLGDLDYVEACAHETMRLRPVAPINTMQAVHDTRVGDVWVPAGVVVMAVMRRDATSERHLPNAAAFEPERWLLDARQVGAAKRLSMPFGAGPRICPGRYLALMEIKLACALLLRHFDIAAVDTPDGRAPRELLQLAMGPVGLTMRLRPRA